MPRIHRIPPSRHLLLPRRPSVAVVVALLVASTMPIAIAANITPAAAAPAPAQSAPAVSSPYVDPDLDAQLTDAPTTTVLVRLATEFTGSDAARTTAARSAVGALLRTLPAGSYADVGDSGVLPIAIFRASRAAVDVLRHSPLVTSVGVDRPMEVASENARFRDGAASSNALGYKGDGTVVAVIDSGVDTTHPYLKSGNTSKVIGEVCFATPVNQAATGTTPAINFHSPCPGGVAMSTTAAAVAGSAGPCPYAASPYNDTTNACDHGTHVAGVVAGEPGVSGFNDLSGVAPNARIIAIQVFGFLTIGGTPRGVTSNATDIIKSLQWLYNRRADYPGLSAVNISIATIDIAKKSDNCDVRDATMKAAVDQLRSVGIATIAAAGHSGWDDGMGSPACVTTTVGTGAIDDTTGARASFSNIGNSIELFAPGANIASAYPGVPSTPKYESGTSQASPAVAGAWALMRQKYPNSGSTPKTVTEILELLRSTGTTVTTTVSLTNGPVTYSAPRVNIEKALGAPEPTRIAAGGNFSCARDGDTTVTCTGGNEAGQLGNGTTVASSVPIRVPGLTDVTNLAVGGAFACAWLGSGSARCWGLNASGQLGVGTTTNSSSPVTVTSDGTTPLTGITALGARGSAVCAVINGGAAGTVKCWGDNSSGQLGDGTTTSRSLPVQVMASAGVPLTGVKNISMGNVSACALMNSGAVRCWGANTYGGLGNNSLVSSNYPVAVSGITGTTVKASTVRVGNGFACAVLSTGSARCWGRNNVGQLGNNTTTDSKVPVNVLGPLGAVLTGVTALQPGTQHACAIATVSGISKVLCWGNNADRQLGNGSVNRSVATATFGTSTDGALALGCGPGHTLVVVTNAVVAFGKNTNGQLGIGSVTPISPTWALRF